MELNKIVRLCCAKIEDGEKYYYKIEGALFICSFLNSQKAFGYHFKKQGGQTFGEYNLTIDFIFLDENYEKLTDESDVEKPCKRESGFLMKDCCANYEWGTNIYDLHSDEFKSNFINESEFNQVDNEFHKISSKYLIPDIVENQNSSLINGYLFPIELQDNLKLFDNLFWIEINDFLDSESKLNKLDIEIVSEQVPGNMLFMY